MALKPVVLCILDGWGLAPPSPSNAVSEAETPTFDRLMAGCPQARLVTHGASVGLPDGQMGNSEVGHTTIGAGRVVWMDLPRINRAIADGSFRTNPAINRFADAVRAAGGRAHLAGIVSDGGVHGHTDHMVAAAQAMADCGLQVDIHAWADGRDVGPTTAARHLADLEGRLPDGARIATVSGRYFAMDRDKRWDRVQRAWDAMVRGRGLPAPDAQAAVAGAAANGETDEFITPHVIGDYAGMADGDGLFILNFRADRAREIATAIAAPAFDGFDRPVRPALSAALGMVSYSDAIDAFMDTAFAKPDIPDTLAEVVSRAGLRQFHVAETEKYPHVTFFLNGGAEAAFPGEDRLMPSSPKVTTYDLAPEMSAEAVCDAVCDAIDKGYDLIVANFANPDMVGHTGVLPAAIRAVETVDRCLARIVDEVTAAGGAMIVTADHGNCEVMVDPDTGGPHTAHTTNPVPVILVGGPEGAALRDGTLADLAPTLLKLLGLPQPEAMTGTPLA